MSVTIEQVKEVIQTTQPDPVVNVWLMAAIAIVNDNLTCIGSDQTKIDSITIFLAAHLIGLLDPSVAGFVVEEGPKGFTTKYSNPAKLVDSINSTPYGKTANLLAGGCLASVGEKIATVEFF